MSTGWNDLAELEQEAQKPGDNDNNLLLVDGTNVAFRFFGRANYDNYKTDYIRTVQSLGKSYGARKIICCFDIGASEYRKELLGEYKSHRKENRTEEDQERFDAFFACLRDITEDLPFEHYKFKGIEADDIIAHLSQTLKDNYDHIWIVSSDKDLYQLLDSEISIFNIFGNGDKREVTIDSLHERFEMTPEEFLFAKIIQGDKSDNIPGISGIGEVRSRKLVKEYGTLDNLLAALPIAGKAKYIQNLNAGKDTLILNEKLISLIKYNDDIVGVNDTAKEVLDEVE